MVTLKFSEAKVFRRIRSLQSLLRVQTDILKSSLSNHYSPLKHLELHVQKVSLQKALVTIHHVGCSIMWETSGKKYRTRVMSSFVFTVLAAPGFMCSPIPASTSLPLVHQAALAATCRPQVRTAAHFILLSWMPLAPTTDQEGNNSGTHTYKYILRTGIRKFRVV